MPNCSNSDHDITRMLAATIDDVLNLVATGTPDFDEFTGAAKALQPLEPSLVFLVLGDGTVVLVHARNVETDRDVAEEVAKHLNVLAPGATRLVRVDSEGGTRAALAVSLSAETGDIALVCLVDPSRLPISWESDAEFGKLAMLGALGWVAAQSKAENIQMLVRAEQLAAGHESLQESYARSLTKAVEQREERLREQEEHTSRLKAVMMTAADGIVTVDVEGSIESFNAAAAEIFGYTPDEAIGSDVSILFPDDAPSSAGVFCDCLSDAYEGGRRASAHQLLGRRKDGTIFPLELAISDVALENRRIITAILRDITERKAAERELKRLHLFNRMILDSAGEGIVGLDREGRVAFVNPAAEQIFGCQSAQFVGNVLHELTHHSRPNGTPYPWHECPIHKTLTTGAIHREDSEVFWRGDGTSFPVEYVATPMREENEIVGAVLTFQDITQRKTLEAQLVQAQKLESIGQLAAGIAHEINTPTQFVGDNLRFLKDAFRDLEPLVKLACERSGGGSAAAAEEIGPGETGGAVDLDEVAYLLEEVPGAISQSLDGVERVAKIVRSMKEFSHPGSDEMQSIDLNRAIESTLTVCRNEWKYVADVVTDFDPNLPPVTCLPGECNQVFLNLIINASHAIAEAQGDNTQAKGTITVSTRNLDDAVEVRIADTGTGIPEEARRKVFDPFFTTKQVGRGTGQGLAIARSVVVDKHGGSLSFETEVGLGTAFIVRLPLSSR